MLSWGGIFKPRQKGIENCGGSNRIVCTHRGKHWGRMLSAKSKDENSEIKRKKMGICFNKKWKKWGSWGRSRLVYSQDMCYIIWGVLG
jgi:hypothetical protein